MKLARLILLASASMSSMATAQSAAQPAVPDNAPIIVAGSATFSTDTAGTVRTITQTTDRAFLDWSTLNVPQDHTLRFDQPDANAITLNRVTGGSSSVIDGLIEANGQVWVLNPNGVFISPTGQVTTPGFLASTGNISHTDFMAETTQSTFSNSGATASIINQGTITSSLGYTILHAPSVQNSGGIAANQGLVLLASADNLSISFDQGALISYDLSNNSSIPAAFRDITNTGTITANGGMVALSMASALGAISGVINVEGIIEAKSVQTSTGSVVLDAGENGALFVNGTVSVEGTQTGEAGGDITLRGALVTVDSHGSLIADGAAGGGEISIAAKPAAQTDVDFSSVSFSGTSVSTVSQLPVLQRERLINGSLASVAIKQGSILSANATELGDGGFILLDANDSLGLAAKVAGQLSANGAGAQGAGGEIALGGFYLDIDGAVLQANGGGPLAMPGIVELTAASIDVVEQLTPAASDVLTWQSSASLPFYDPADLQTLDLRDLQVAEAVPIGFDFLYFGETFNSLEVSYAGLVSFGRLNGNPLCCNGLPLANIETPPAIFGLWTDLGIEVDPGSNTINTPSGKPLFGTFNLPDGGQEFVLQWRSVPEFFSEGSGNTFEIRIRDNGAITLNYGALDVVNHSVTAGLIGRTINDTSQLFFREINQANALLDVSQTSSTFHQPNSISQITGQSIQNILDGGANVSINAKDFTTANNANSAIGNVNIATPSSLSFPLTGPTRQIFVTADKNIRIEDDQIFSGPVQVGLAADANADGIGGTIRLGNILDASLIDITGDVLLSGLTELRSLGDIVVRGDILTAPESAGSQLILNAQDTLTVTGSVGDALLTFAAFNSNNFDIQAVSADEINIDVFNTGIVAGPVTAASLSKFGPGNLTLTAANSGLGELRIAEGRLLAPGVASIGPGAIVFGSGTLEFTDLSAITLSNPIVVQQSAEIIFGGSGTIAGTTNSFSDGIGDLDVKAGGDLTFAGEIGTSKRFDGIFGTAQGRIALGLDARLAATNVIQILGFAGFNNFSPSAEVLTSGEWFVWSGNPNPFTGSTPDVTGALQHDWRFYGISEAMVRGDARPPERPAGANGLGYSFAPVLTPQTAGSLSKLYDGTRTFSAEQISLNFGGLVNGDVAGNVGVVSILADVADVSATQANISGITASFTDTAGKPVFGYTFSSTATAPASILPRPLLASLIGTVSRDYDGTTTALLTGGNFAFDGLVTGEAITVTQTAGRFATQNVGNDLLVSAGLTSADFAAGSGTDLRNYLLPTTASGTIGSILPLVLTYRANPAVRFVGATNPVFTGAVTGFLQGESAETATSGKVAFTSPATAESESGLYPIAGSGLTATNYIFVQAPANATALTVQPNIINQVSGANAAPQAPATAPSGAPSTGPTSSSGSGSNSGTGSDGGTGTGGQSETGTDASPAGSDEASTSDQSSSSSESPDAGDGAAQSDSSDGAAKSDSPEGPAPSGSTEATSGGAENSDTGAPSSSDGGSSTDQPAPQQSSPAVIAVEVEAADPLPPSPVGDEPTPVPSDAEDSSDPVLAAVSAEDNTQPTSTSSVQQQIVAITPLVSVSPQQPARSSRKVQDDARSINVLLNP